LPAGVGGHARLALYALTRADLSQAQQAVQAAHAAVTYAAAHPAAAALPLVILAARDEPGLSWFMAECEREGIIMSAFTEPDLGDQLTAVAFCGGGRIARRYPLALKETPC
jgi:hypothetical protein